MLTQITSACKCTKIKEILKLKKTTTHTFFLNTRNKHIWEIILAYLKDDCSNTRTFMILTKTILLSYYPDPDEAMLTVYKNFWQKIHPLSNAMNVLRENPFGFGIFRNPCPRIMREHTGTVTFESKSWHDIDDFRYANIPSVAQVYTERTKEWFPHIEGTSVIRYDYINGLLEVCSLNTTIECIRDRWPTSWCYVSFTVNLPLVSHFKSSSGKLYFFYLPTGFRGDLFHIIYNHRSGECKLKFWINEYYNNPNNELSECHLEYTITMNLNVPTKPFKYQYELFDYSIHGYCKKHCCNKSHYLHYCDCM